MNTPLLLLLTVAALPLTATGAVPAATWDFNAVPATAEGTNSPPVSEGAGTARLRGGVTATFAVGGPGGGRAWNLGRFPAQGKDPATAGVRFEVSTSGLDSLQLRYQHRFSARASGRVLVRATGDGVRYVDVLRYEAPGADTWTNVVVTFDPIPFAPDNAAFAVEVVSEFAANTNRYAAAGPGSTYAASGTWRLDNVQVTGEPTAQAPAEPRIVVSPTGGTLRSGEPLQLGVGATGEAPLEYQWQRDDTDLPGEVGPILTRETVLAEDAGRYRVVVRNRLGEAVSDEARVTVLPPPPPYLSVDCATLRAAVVGPEYAWSGPDSLVAVEGIVTTHASLAPPGNLLFALQDATGGITVVWREAPPEFLPAAGTRVRVVGPVGQSRGMLQLTPTFNEGLQGVTVLEEGLPLPDPVEFDGWDTTDTARMESLEGRRVRVSGVTLDTRTPLFPVQGATLALTFLDSGKTLPLRLDGDSQGVRVDLAGQPKPTGPFSVTGIWFQSDASKPWTGGYQILPTRYADLVPDGRPPDVSWTAEIGSAPPGVEVRTNSFAEQVLRTGGTLRLVVEFSEEQGPLTSASPAILPPNARLEWFPEVISDEGRHRLRAEVRFTATPDLAGQVHRVRLSVAGSEATRHASWTIHIPTAAEQQVVISEFLANPVLKPDAPGFNPLGRHPWPPDDPAIAARISAWDEFVELVNLGPAPVSLGGWTLSDGSRTQAWLDPEDPRSTVPSQGALVIHGGPAGSHDPRIPVPAIVAVPSAGASPGTDGLGLNNGGDQLVLRNAAGNLIERIVYGPGQVSATGSLVRWPLPDGPWSAHSTVAPETSASPGVPPMGTRWIEPGTSESLTLNLQIQGSQIRFEWDARPGRTYSLRERTLGSGEWRTLARDLAETVYTLPMDSDQPKLFQVTSP